MDVEATNPREMWLVKVPKYIATTWKESSQKQQADLGRLQINKADGSMKFITTAKDSDSSEELSLTLKSISHQKMMILSTSENKLAHEGDIKLRGELKALDSKKYMNLKTTSIREAAKPTRVTQILDKAVTSYKPRSATQLAHEADLRKKKDEAKKLVREDKEIVQNRLFAAFEKQRYYNIKDLVKITNQSIPYLKEILREICVYCSNGSHKNMYELKPEYRHYQS